MTDTSRESAADSVISTATGASAGPEVPVAPPKGEKARSLGQDAWEELRRRPMFWISAALILVFVLMAIFPQLFTRTDPNFADLAKAREAPSADAWFGRDNQGYDVFARTIYGARASILVGLFATLFTLLFGSLVGIVSGYRGGWIDAVLSRFGEIFLGIPALLGGILFLYVFPSPLGTPFIVVVGKVAVVLALLSWPVIARLMRSSVLQVKPNDYVQAARALGASPGRIITAAHPAELVGLGDRRVDHQPGGLHLRRGDAVLPGGRPAAAGHLLGDRDLGGVRHRLHPGRAVDAAVPQRLPVSHRAGLHHARRRRARRPRSETALRRKPT